MLAVVWIDMIRLTGLTHRQKAVVDLLWNCHSLAAAQALIAALPTHRDRCDAHSLLQIVAWDSIEQEEGLDDYSQDCADVILRVRSSS